MVFPLGVTGLRRMRFFEQTKVSVVGALRKDLQSRRKPLPQRGIFGIQGVAHGHKEQNGRIGAKVLVLFRLS